MFLYMLCRFLPIHVHVHAAFLYIWGGETQCVLEDEVSILTGGGGGGGGSMFPHEKFKI